MPLATPQGTLDFKSVDTITFVGASSNTVIDTTTGSFGVGVDANGPTSNLHVVGDALITGNVSDLNIVSNVNMLHTSNTASIKLNSNVVTEFPRSKKLIKYPRVAMTGYSQDGYVVSSTTNYYDSGNPLYPWQVFNDSGQRYQSIRSDYSSSTGNYTGTVNQTTVDGSLIGGEWVQLELPNKISLNRFTVALNMGSHGGRMGRSYVLAGSNNGSTWTTVSTHTQSYGNGADGNHVNHNVNSTTTYKYYRLIATSTFHNTQANGGPWALGKWELFGTPEYDPEAHGVDVTVKSLPNVPNTDWLEVYYDAKDLADGAVTSVNDLKPSSLGSAINSSSVTNVTVSDEAFVFNGSSSGINATLSNPQGPWVHSVSVWVKLGKDHSDYTGDNVFSLGNAASTAQLESLRIHSNDVRFITFQSGADPTYSLPMDRDRWYHFTLTYDGGAATNSFKLFRDGLESTGTTTATPIALNVAANSLLSIGYERVRNTSRFTGSIANFRLFNRALTSDEIYQLYAYQKEYFGHGDLSMTLKAGRLGIGTTEPRAALDVRGDIIGGMPVFFDVRFTSAPTATHAGSRIVFDTINNSRGGGFDTSTGTFKAPIAGQYKFSYFMRGNIANQSFKIKPQINGSPTFATTSDGTDEDILGTAFCGGDGISGSAVCIVSLEVGGTFSLFVSTHGTTITSSLASFYNGFTGEYISSL